MSCSPWIIEDMHITSQVGSRYFFIVTASDQYESENRVLVAVFQISNKNMLNNF